MTRKSCALWTSRPSRSKTSPISARKPQLQQVAVAVVVAAVHAVAVAAPAVVAVVAPVALAANLSVSQTALQAHVTQTWEFRISLCEEHGSAKLRGSQVLYTQEQDMEARSSEILSKGKSRQR